MERWGVCAPQRATERNVLVVTARGAGGGQPWAHSPLLATQEEKPSLNPSSQSLLFAFRIYCSVPVFFKQTLEIPEACPLSLE